MPLKVNRFGDLRRNTLICCRRTRISASSRALERNKPASADHSSMRASTIGHEHHPIRAARQPYGVSDKDSHNRTHAQQQTTCEAQAHSSTNAWRTKENSLFFYCLSTGGVMN
jgi:hypothetical protein